MQRLLPAIRACAQGARTAGYAVRPQQRLVAPLAPTRLLLRGVGTATPPPRIHGDLGVDDVSSKAMKRRVAARVAADKRAAAEVDAVAATAPPPDAWTAALQQYSATPAPPPVTHTPLPPPPYREPTLLDSMKHYFISGIAIALAFTLVRALIG